MFRRFENHLNLKVGDPSACFPIALLWMCNQWPYQLRLPSDAFVDPPLESEVKPCETRSLFFAFLHRIIYIHPLVI